MTTLLLRRMRPAAVFLTASSALFAVHDLRRSSLSVPLLCDTRAPSRPDTSPVSSQPSRNNASSLLQPRLMRQMSAGSIIGFGAGLAVGVFSKPLTVLLGLLVLGVQWIESRGIRVIPYQWIQRRASRVDIGKFMRENVPFKIAFGATFALAGFAEF